MSRQPKGENFHRVKVTNFTYNDKIARSIVPYKTDICFISISVTILSGFLRSVLAMISIVFPD